MKSNFCMSCLTEIGSQGVSAPIGTYHKKCARNLFLTSRLPHCTLTRSEAISPQMVEKNLLRVSISGMQPKLSVQLSADKKELLATAMAGLYILKPSPENYPQAAEAELFGMVAAKRVGINVPPCALIRMADGELAYLVRRFDRTDTGQKNAKVEDMAQIMNFARDEKGEFKYKSSYEEAIDEAVKACGNKRIVGQHIFQRIIYCYLCLNDDYHLKNISLIAYEPFQKTHELDGLSPAYDMLPTEIWGSKIGNRLALHLLREEKDGTYSKHFKSLGFHCLADFLELAKRIQIPDKQARKVIVQILEKLDLVEDALSSDVLSARNRTIFLDGMRDRMKALKNEGL